LFIIDVFLSFGVGNTAVTESVHNYSHWKTLTWMKTHIAT